MATKKLIQTMLNTFSHLWEKEINDDIFDIYSRALSGYADEAVQKAAYKCMDECQFMPKPVEIIDRIHKRREEINYEKKFNMYSGHCQVCGKSGIITMKDDEQDGLWKCRNCYTGMTNSEISARYQNLAKILSQMGTRCKTTKISPKEKRRRSLGFKVPDNFPIMTKKEELDRKQYLLEQYQKIKAGEVNLNEPEELPF